MKSTSPIAQCTLHICKYFSEFAIRCKSRDTVTLLSILMQTGSGINGDDLYYSNTFIYPLIVSHWERCSETPSIPPPPPPPDTAGRSLDLGVSSGGVGRGGGVGKGGSTAWARQQGGSTTSAPTAVKSWHESAVQWLTTRWLCNCNSIVEPPVNLMVVIVSSNMFNQWRPVLYFCNVYPHGGNWSRLCLYIQYMEL